MEAKEVIALRKKLNLTQESFGQLIGVSKNTVYNYEDGKKIPESKLRMLNNLIQSGAASNETIDIVSDHNIDDKEVHGHNIVKESNVAESYAAKVSSVKGAPYFDVDFIGGFDIVMNNQSAKPTFYIDFPGFNDVDCWINITGKSMSPFISHGDIVALKKVNNWDQFLLFGEIYAVVSDEFRTIKIVGKSEKEDCFKLIPYSKSPEFSEQDIPKSIIKEVYRVKGSLKKFF